METVFGILRVIGIMFMVLMVFNVIILIHEWGHYLAARWRGLKVEKFQIWFGKPLWKKEINGVQYGLGCIPAGGFVALPQMAPMEAIEGGEGNREKLPTISPLDKIIVAFAGPLFSLALAFVFACVVWLVKSPEAMGVTTTEVGYVVKGSVAEEAGIKVGDSIVSVDGKAVTNFSKMVDSVVWNVIASENDPIEFVVKRGDELLEIPVKRKVAEPEEGATWFGELFKRPALPSVGLMGRSVPMVGSLIKHGPADDAGLEASDLVVGVALADGSERTELAHPIGLSDFIRAHPGATVKLFVDRGGESLELQMSPRKPDRPDPLPEYVDRPMIGISWDETGETTLVRASPLLQVKNSMLTMKNTIGAVISPRSKVSAQHLSGPLGIMRLYYRLFEHRDGWRLVLWFSVVLNVNLAILNMLPFPVLDGGHITTALLEWIRRKPLPVKLLEMVQVGCVLLLFSFIIFVTMKDAGDWVGESTGGGAEIEFLPSAERAVE
ncbi:MAG: RIP metalloprotease RseP [Verrucomicrobiales bacterium]|nr:RIP metalloprotease RseP [Verrucomicrobiales bacterium]